MDSSSLLLSCSKQSVLNNGQLEFIFKWSVLNNGQLKLLFQVVSPKQWTTWVYLHFPQSVIPCFVRKRDVTQSFASLSNFIPRFVGTRNIKFHSPLCRNTEYQMSFPGLSEHGISSVIPRLSDDEMSKVSFPVCLVQRCHQSKCLFLQTISLQIHFKFPNTTINTVVDNHSSPVELQYSLAESDPFSFKTNHLCHPTFIITSPSIHNILSQKMVY